MGSAVKPVPEGTHTITPGMIVNGAAEAIAYYKVPDRVEIRSEPLPRNASGKVMKHVLAGTEASGFTDDES